MLLLAAGHKRTGACPTFDRPVLQRDGYLLRIPLVGGALDPSTAARIAEVAGTLGNGTIELTNRGNLQIRGLAVGAADQAREMLRSCGLGERAAALVTISPFAGPAEHELRRQIVAELEHALAAGRELSPKFVIHIDDHQGTTAARRAEATLSLQGGSCRIRIAHLGEATIALADAVRAAGALADACRAVADDARVADVIDERGLAWLHAVLPIDLSARLGPEGAPEAPPFGGPYVAASGQEVFLAGARFGRIEAGVLARLASLGLDLYVTPWRSIALGGSPPDLVGAELADTLSVLGLITDPHDPAAGIVSCIGAAGCWQSEADTLVEAERVVARRLATGLPGPGIVHVSGCDKRCATRGAVSVTLLGRPDGSGFDEVVS
ncbi:MAG: hypothetical protein ABIP03_05425 [Aquihabitans sp.]